MTINIKTGDINRAVLDSLDLTVQYHEASDRYYFVSKTTDEDGVPLVECQINRATIGGVDVRKDFAIALHALFTQTVEARRALNVIVDKAVP